MSALRVSDVTGFLASMFNACGIVSGILDMVPLAIASLVAATVFLIASIVSFIIHRRNP